MKLSQMKAKIGKSGYIITEKSAKYKSWSKGQKANTGFKEIENLGELGPYKVRIIEVNGDPRMDVRKYVESEGYTGFTKQGILLTPEQVNEMKEWCEYALLKLGVDPEVKEKEKVKEAKPKKPVAKKKAVKKAKKGGK